MGDNITDKTLLYVKAEYYDKLKEAFSKLKFEQGNDGNFLKKGEENSITKVNCQTSSNLEVYNGSIMEETWESPYELLKISGDPTITAITKELLEKKVEIAFWDTSDGGKARRIDSLESVATPK